MKGQQETQIPKTGSFVGLIAVVEDVKKILEEIDFLESDGTDLLLNLCDDALTFLDNKEPRLFVMYLSHIFRELVEKFFGEAKSVSDSDYFDFSPNISNELLSELDDASKFSFVENRIDNKIKIKKLIEIEDRDTLLRISTEELWHKDIWRLNKRYANNDSSKRDLGTKQFYDAIPAKYSVSAWSFQELTRKRKALYKKLSGYAHGGKIKKIVDALDKENPNAKEKLLITKYVGTHTSIIEIFRPFETTTNNRIKEIDDLLDE